VAVFIETSLSSGRDILRGVARYTREVGSWSVYHEPRGLEDDVPNWLRNWQGDGIIARFQNERIATAVMRTGVPVVDTLNVVSVPGVPVVHVDNKGIARLGVDHFLSQGYRSFGFCNIRGMSWSEERLVAFSEGLADAGHGCSVYQMATQTRTRWNWEQRQDRLAEWIAQLDKPAAVLVCSDQRAQFVLDACRRVGARVPDDVAVLGVDDDDAICEICDPPLSSVRPNHEQVGYLAAQLLHRMMNGEAWDGSPVYVPPLEVHARLSTDKIAIKESPVAQAVRFIREHACEGISAVDVVQHVPMSRSVLQRHFRDRLRCSIQEEIINVRVGAAKSLLLNTDLSLALIAERAGFNHQRYMGAVFSQRLGISPGRFRLSCGR